jgi:tetratricopeptide (TPR) repeat protein
MVCTPSVAELDDQRRLSHLFMLAGHLLLERGDFAGARARYEEGLAVRREVRADGEIGWSLLELGQAAWCQRDWKTARGHVAEAAALFQKHADRTNLLVVLESLAGIAAGQGQSERDPAAMLRAARLFAAAQELRHSLNIAPIVFWRRSRARLLEAARFISARSSSLFIAAAPASTSQFTSDPALVVWRVQAGRPCFWQVR